MVYCPGCEEDNPSDTKTCKNCGLALETSENLLSHEHAGFLVRFVANIIDSFILNTVRFLCKFVT